MDLTPEEVEGIVVKLEGKVQLLEKQHLFFAGKTLALIRSYRVDLEEALLLGQTPRGLSNTLNSLAFQLEESLRSVGNLPEQSLLYSTQSALQTALDRVLKLTSKEQNKKKVAKIFETLEKSCRLQREGGSHANAVKYQEKIAKLQKKLLEKDAVIQCANATPIPVARSPITAMSTGSLKQQLIQMTHERDSYRGWKEMHEHIDGEHFIQNLSGRLNKLGRDLKKFTNDHLSVLKDNKVLNSFEQHVAETLEDLRTPYDHKRNGKKIRHLEEIIEKLRGESLQIRENVEQQMKQLERELSAERDRNRELTTENQEIKLKMTHSDSGNYQTQLSKIQELLLQKEKNIFELNTIIEGLNEEIKNAKRNDAKQTAIYEELLTTAKQKDKVKRDEANSMADQIASFTQHLIPQLKSQIKEFKEMNCELESELHRVIQSLSNKSSEHEILSMKYEVVLVSSTEIKNENNDLRAEIKEIMLTYEQLEAIINKLQTEKTELLESYREIAPQVRDKHMEVQHSDGILISSSGSPLQEQCDSLKSQHDLLIKKSIDCKANIAENSEHFLSSLTTVMNQLAHSFSSTLPGRIDSLQSKLRLLRQKSAGLSKSYQLVLSTLTQSKLNESQLQDLIDSKSATVIRLTEDLLRFKKEREVINSDFPNKALKREIISLKELNEDLNQRLALIEQDDIDHIKNTFNNQIGILQRDLELSQKILREKEGILQQASSKYETTLDSLSKQLASQTLQIASYKRKIESLNQRREIPDDAVITQKCWAKNTEWVLVHTAQEDFWELAAELHRTLPEDISSEAPLPIQSETSPEVRPPCGEEPNPDLQEELNSKSRELEQLKDVISGRDEVIKVHGEKLQKYKDLIQDYEAEDQKTKHLAIMIDKLNTALSPIKSQGVVDILRMINSMLNK